MNALDALPDPPQWHEPIDLLATFKLPRPDPEMFPGCISEFAWDSGERIGADPAAVALACVAACAAALDDRIQIQPKRRDVFWTENPRLWFGLVGRPSTKKTPILSAALGPLRRIEADIRREYDHVHSQWREAAQADKKSAGPEPIMQRVIVSDSTTEKLSDILSRQEPRGIAIVNDELSGWIHSMDAYKSGHKDRAASLELYQGGPRSVDRVQRGSMFVENWSASIIGGIQPDVLYEHSQKSLHDGLLQRFILYFADDASMGEDRIPNQSAKHEYGELIRSLHKVQYSDSFVKLTDYAHDIRQEFEQRIFTLQTATPNVFLDAALGKWPATFARVLLVFHCIESVHERFDPTAQPVSGETAAKVSGLFLGTLLAHAINFYERMDPAADEARTLANILLARFHGKQRFTVRRDLALNWKHSRKLTPWQIDAVLDRLEACSWIQPDESARLNERGRPSAYWINPQIHVRFHEAAARECERRNQVAQVMAEISTAGGNCHATW